MEASLLVSNYIIMEANKILQADFLDILFDEKNKEYGAYQLRKTYNKRLTIAIAGMFSILLLFFFGSVLASTLTKKEVVVQEVTKEIILEEVTKKPDEIKLPPPPEVKAMKPLNLKTINVTPPIITPDDQVKPDEQPPVVEDIADAQISTVNNKDGIDGGDIVAPPVEIGTGGSVVAPLVKKEDYDGVFTSVQIAASFKGGPEAWKRYLERNLNYPDEAQEKGTQATVYVSLVVDKYGKVSEVKALNNPGDGLAEEAIRIIKKCPDWVPAEQNGNKVSYRFKQSVTFMLN